MKVETALSILGILLIGLFAMLLSLVAPSPETIAVETTINTADVVLNELKNTSGFTIPEELEQPFHMGKVIAEIILYFVIPVVSIISIIEWIVSNTNKYL